MDKCDVWNWNREKYGLGKTGLQPKRFWTNFSQFWVTDSENDAFMLKDAVDFNFNNMLLGQF